MKFIYLLILAISLFAISAAQEVKWEGKAVNFSHGKLIVDQSGNFIVFEDGTPFFYLGDTSWELFHRLDKKDTELYLEDRREKGFTVIQSVALAELDGLNTPNMEGEKPLFENDPTRPNEKYFEHVDWVVKKAMEKGLFIGMLPTWGDKVDVRGRTGPQIFNEENAFEYGKFIGDRYKSYPNIIWINGGDRSGGGENFMVWDALARGIKSVDKNHLMTFHPWGENSSSNWFNHSDWLDFHMFQSGHRQRSYGIYRQILIPDYERYPKRPVIDGEPRYEAHSVAWEPERRGWFDDQDVRQAMYWSLFSGAFGHVYGSNNIWQMLTPEREALSGGKPMAGKCNSWKEELDLPGAWDMIHGRKLMLSRPFTERIPYQKIIANEYMQETDYCVATRGENYIFVYIPTGRHTKLHLDYCGWVKTKVWWYDPRTGKAEEVGIFPANGTRGFIPPVKGRQDWILVLDNAEVDLAEPGVL